MGRPGTVAGARHRRQRRHHRPPRRARRAGEAPRRRRHRLSRRVRDAARVPRPSGAARSAVLDPVGFAAFEADLGTALDGIGGLSWLGARSGLLDGEVRAAAAAYRAADTLGTGVHDALVGLRDLPGALGAGGAALARTPRPARRGPAGADPRSRHRRRRHRRPRAARTHRARRVGVPDGHGVARATGTDTRGVAGRPPRSLADLVRGLARRNDDPHHGAVDVRMLTSPDGTRRVVVDITGTKSWDPAPTGDVTSLSTNGRALVGRSGAYEQGVLAAMTQAGVRPTDEVMLVGHSEGGAVAVTTARDAVRSGRFRVTHVVTAGSPVGRTAGELPGSVRLLALENTRDVVPHLDGTANPDGPTSPPRVPLTATAPSLDDHSLEHGYVPVARGRAGSGRARSATSSAAPTATCGAHRSPRTPSRSCADTEVRALAVRRWVHDDPPHARVDAGRPADHQLDPRARGPVLPEQADRHAHRDRHRAAHTGRRPRRRAAGGVVPRLRRCLAETGASAPSPGTRPAPVAVLRHPGQRARHAHHQHPLLRRAADLHRRARRGRGRLRRPVAAAAVRPVPAAAVDGAPRRGDGRRRGRRDPRRPAHRPLGRRRWQAPNRPT